MSACLTYDTLLLEGVGWLLAAHFHRGLDRFREDQYVSGFSCEMAL